jgi:type IV secretory pathway VirB10-like protein
MQRQSSCRSPSKMAKVENKTRKLMFEIVIRFFALFQTREFLKKNQANPNQYFQLNQIKTKHSPMDIEQHSINKEPHNKYIEVSAMIENQSASPHILGVVCRRLRVANHHPCRSRT